MGWRLAGSIAGNLDGAGALGDARGGVPLALARVRPGPDASPIPRDSLAKRSGGDAAVPGDFGRGGDAGWNQRRTPLASRGNRAALERSRIVGASPGGGHGTGPDRPAGSHSRAAAHLRSTGAAGGTRWTGGDLSMAHQSIDAVERS